MASVEPSLLTEVRLTSFKSYRDERLPLDDLTLVVGRNGSGKSNALDALWVLARLATGEDLRDALDGGREGSAVRGGAAGCVPFGQRVFSLGCTVRTGSSAVQLDVAIQVEPVVQIVYERLTIRAEELLVTDSPFVDSSDINARWKNGVQGPNPSVSFRATRLLSSQVLSRIPATRAGQTIHLAAAQVIAALQGVFVLDPVPAAMRAYVNERDTLLRRDAGNLSAAIGELIRDENTKAVLVRALNDLNEQLVVGITVESSSLGDVILAIVESVGAKEYPVSARSASDGTLRFLAILAALLQAPDSTISPEVRSVDEAVGQTQMVIEELENGLHASQAATLVRLIRDSLRVRRIRALATAHSPAVLDALEPSEHRSVIVCQRDVDGRSRLRRLTDMESYVDISAMGSLGRAASRDKLRDRPPTDRAAALAVLDDLLGGSS